MLSRRDFLQLSGAAAVVLAQRPEGEAAEPRDDARRQSGERPRSLTLFLCGDVMTGRGLDQVLPHPSDPRLHESVMASALGYVRLAERAHGPIPRPVSFDYIWGDALDVWRQVAPDVRIVNLETSVTTSGEWLDKGINYRMHPKNVPCLEAAAIDACTLANNHVLDWGEAGLAETLDVLERAGIATAGAGRTPAAAAAPAILDVDDAARVIVFAFGTVTSGIPRGWAAASRRPGVNLLSDLSTATAERIGARVAAVKRSGDLVVASIHWGGNWGYRIPAAHRTFAHALVERAGVDIVHGHSSHHPLGIEVHHGKPILYGCGDFLNDYEGIEGHDAFRGELVLMYFVDFDVTAGHLARLRMTPLEIRRFRLRRSSAADAEWLRGVLDREGRPLGTRVHRQGDGTLDVEW